jgi:ketosteroid isomerase-like protein
MSQENVEIVRRIMQRLAAQEIDAALRDIDADAKLDWSASEAPDSGVYHGHAEWRAWFAGRAEGLGELRFAATEVIDGGPDTVLVGARLIGRGRSSGVEVEALGAGVWTLRDGMVTGLTLYQTRDEALRAVGLAQ